MVAVTGVLVVAVPAGTSAPAPPADARDAAAHWTPERRAAAVPRDIVVDERGLAYLKLPGGVLEPYGHAAPARVQARPAPAAPTPAAKPGGASDTTPPAIENEDPPNGATIGSAYTFKATVTDASGVKSVSFVLTYPDGRTQSYSAAKGANDVWRVAFSGFWDGNWKWQIVAKDNATRGGNTATSEQYAFTVDTGGGGGGGGGGGDDTVTNAEWTAGGAVQTAAGRIYFEMPSNKAHTRWTGYVCSGTAVGDSTTNDRSVILTAAHCVYDDVNKAFARNVLFIPDQDGTSGGGTDRDCSNDPLGCWAPEYGVVDSDWASRSWPDNIPWDYAFYVVPTSGAHSGKAASSDSLEVAAGTLPISFSSPATGAGAFTHALGYSYSDDPNFMYCAEDMTTEGDSNWWLSQCGLSGGSSGGPWVQPMGQNGSGPVISVNSWGYRGSPGMAGPKLFGTSAQCLYAEADAGTTTAVNRGVIPSGC